MLINFHIHQKGVFSQSELCFHTIKNVYRDKNVLLLLSKVIKIACYSCQILKLFLIIVFLITDGIVKYIIN
jgi:hypothetical protein